jgi:putative MFS transporter
VDTTERDLVALIDASPLKPRYWAVCGLIMTVMIFELFDFFVVGYLVSALAPEWKLTFGQTTIMLLSAGVGAMAGAVLFGVIADRIGRRTGVVLSTTLCCLAAGSIGLIPDGAWQMFAALRFLVGMGYGGAGASQFALIVEYTPTSRRTLLTSSLGVPTGVGLLLAAFVVSALFPLLGWRGTALLGYAPIVLVAVLAFVAPESARWLLSKGRTDDARRAAATMLHLPDGPSAAGSPPPAPTVLDAPSDPRRRVALVVLLQLGLGATLTGVLLWGPTILAQLFQITPQQAAGYFVWVSLAGLLGRLAFTFVPARIGRVKTGMIIGYVGGVALALAGLLHDQWLGTLPLFFLCLLVAQFFYDGGFSNLNTYAAELFPVRMGARAMGLSAASGGAGKILGPLVLGLMAGSGNLVSPKATEAAVTPAFLFLGGACLMVGLAYTFLGVETHRRALALA